MPDKLANFLSDVASAKVKGDQAEADIVTKLKGLSPEDFARVPRDVLSGLSARRYAEVVQAIAPELKLKTPIEAAVVAPRPTRSWTEYWSWIPVPVIAVTVSLMAGAVILTAMVYTTPYLEWRSYATPLSRPAQVAKWPRCSRLTRWTDGCVYRVTTGLSWRDAANDLDIPESYFRHLNGHITIDPIPAGSNLTVWRERFPLQDFN